MHALEIVAYRHPVEHVAIQAQKMYYTMVHTLHLQPECKDDMIQRLSEDRFETNTVVS